MEKLTLAMGLGTREALAVRSLGAAKRSAFLQVELDNGNPAAIEALGAAKIVDAMAERDELGSEAAPPAGARESRPRL